MSWLVWAVPIILATCFVFGILYGTNFDELLSEIHQGLKKEE